MKAVKVKTLYADPGKKLEKEVIVTFDSKITGIVPWSAESSLDPSLEVIDMKEKVMVPGLIDGHGHLIHGGDVFRPEDVPHYEKNMEMQVCVRNVRRALSKGITTLRDCGGTAETLFALRQGIREGITEGPDLILAGAPITPTGGHTYYMGGSVDGPVAICKKIREQRLMGADYVKIMVTGGGTPRTLPGVLTFSREELQAAVDEAHRLDRKAIAHATCKQGIVECLEVGVDEIEHCSFTTKGKPDYDPKLAERIVQQNVVVCPTLAVFKESIDYLNQIGQERPLTDYENERLSWFKSMDDVNLELFSLMVRDGISMIAGTDAGWRLNTFGNICKELEYMVNGGMKNIDVLRSTTSFAADVLGIGEKTGRISEGLQADMLVIDGDPADSISNIRNVVQVFKDGKEI